MSFAILRLMLGGVLALACTRACAGGLWWWETRQGRFPSAKPWLHASYTLLAASVFLPMAMLLLDADVFFLAPFELGHHPQSGDLQFGLRPDGIMTNPVTGKAIAFEGIDIAWTERISLAAIVIAALGGFHLLLQAVRLARSCDRAETWKAVGAVRIAVAGSSTVPFCAWTRLGWVVVVPPMALEDRSRLRMIVAHEFAHIRAKHIHASWLGACLRAVMPWNPVVPWWQHWVARMQEIACDQHVLARKSTDRISYARCLLWAAQAASVKGSRRLGLPMAAGSVSALKERMTMILNGHTQLGSRAPVVVAAGIILAALGAVTVQGFAADRRLSLIEVQTIADRYLAPFGIVITIDEMAVDGTNRILTGGRGTFRKAVRRLEVYRKMAGPILAHHGVPEPLLGIPLAESGIGTGIPHEAGAPWPGGPGPRGIWQMTAETARTMGLRVDSSMDERFDQAREVDAAARLLAHLHHRFGNWTLAIAAYNMGPQKVDAAIRNGASKDPNGLRAKGLLNDYLSATVIPAMLVAQAPQLILPGLRESRDPR